MDPRRILVVVCHACQHLTDETMEIVCSYGVNCSPLPIHLRVSTNIIPASFFSSSYITIIPSFPCPFSSLTSHFLFLKFFSIPNTTITFPTIRKRLSKSITNILPASDKYRNRFHRRYSSSPHIATRYTVSERSLRYGTNHVSRPV